MDSIIHSSSVEILIVHTDRSVAGLFLCDSFSEEVPEVSEKKEERPTVVMESVNIISSVQRLFLE